VKFHPVVFKVATSNRYLPTKLHGVIMQKMTSCKHNTCSWRHLYFRICALVGNYTVYSGNSIPTFRDNLPVRFYRAKKS